MVTKKTSAKKNASKAQTPAPAPKVVVEEPAPAPAPKEVLDTSNASELMFQNILNDLQTQKTAISQLINTVKKLQKDYQKEVKLFKKKKKGTGKKREPSGFAKPAKISKELCTFLGKSEGTEMARTEVTRYLTEYIKQHDLQFAQDKRKIIPDDKLKKLLFKGQKEAEVTYFNLQKWMKPHFESSSTKLQ